MPNNPPTATRKQELGIFLFLTIVLAPVAAVSVVGGYGLAVWLYQTLAGLLGI